MKESRQDHIRALILENNYVSFRELRELYPNVSLMTLHRDIDDLQEEGILVKVRGGARGSQLNSEPLFGVRSRLNVREKQIIAKKAATLVRPGSALFLDAGSTCMAMANHLQDVNMDIITTAPNTAVELCRLNRPSITLCGGKINRVNFAASGQTTLDDLDKVNIDQAFLGASGLIPMSGFVCGKESEMLVKQKVIRKAHQVILLCDSSKFGAILPYTFAAFKDVDVLISDAPLPEDLAREAEAAGTRVL